MTRKQSLSNAILWATAIIVSALVEAPLILTAVLLPTLATFSVLSARPARC